jgi:hypothetical protein
VIPTFNENGWLSEGVHDCSLEEAAARFGAFQVSDRRQRLWEKFIEFIGEAKAVGGLIEALLIDGSFVTSKPNPNDIDLIVVVSAGCDFAMDLQPTQYNLLSQRRVRQRFGFDIVVVRQGSENLKLAIDFFHRSNSGRPKEKVY